MEKQVQSNHPSTINLVVETEEHPNSNIEPVPSSCLNLKGNNHLRDPPVKDKVQQGTGSANQAANQPDNSLEIDWILQLNFYHDQTLLTQLKEIEGDQFPFGSNTVQMSQISVLEMTENSKQSRSIQIQQVQKIENQIQQESINQEQPTKNKNTRRNTNKNTPKSFMKAAVNNFNLDNIQEEHHNYMMMKKKTTIKIEDMRQFWTNQKYGKQNRVMFHNFLRKKAYHWIFNSKVQNRIEYLEDRAMLLQKIKEPFNLKRFKDA